MDIEKVAQAIEDDAGECVEGLRESLAQMRSGSVARECTVDDPVKDVQGFGNPLVEKDC